MTDQEVMADRRATELETKADEMDVEQHVHFSPRRQVLLAGRGADREVPGQGG